MSGIDLLRQFHEPPQQDRRCQSKLHPVTVYWQQTSHTDRDREGGRELNLNFILRMMVLGCGIIFHPVLLACTHNNDTIITLQKKINIIDFNQSLHTHVDSTSKGNWHGIRIEQAKHYKVKRDRLKWRANRINLFVNKKKKKKKNQCVIQPYSTTPFQ